MGLCVSALAASLSVLIMGIGAAIEIADLTCALISSLAVWMIQIEFGGRYAISVYLTSALLAFLLIPVPFPDFYYSLLFGWYPIFKAAVDKKLRRLSLIFKAAVVILTVCFEEILARLVLGYVQSTLLTVIIVIVSCLVYLPYDVLLTRLAILYQKKWRRYIF